MAKFAGIAIALVLSASTVVWAQAPIAPPDVSTMSRESAPSGTPANGFSIDQKGVKRTTGSAQSSGFTIDQKGVKRTGDPLPDVDVSIGKKPGSQRTQSPAMGGAAAAVDTTGRSSHKINTSKSNLRSGDAPVDTVTKALPAVEPDASGGIFKN